MDRQFGRSPGGVTSAPLRRLGACSKACGRNPPRLNRVASAPARRRAILRQARAWGIWRHVGLFVGPRLALCYGLGRSCCFAWLSISPLPWLLLAIGTGAGIGYGVGHILHDPSGPLAFAFWGGVVGFVLVMVRALLDPRIYPLCPEGRSRGGHGAADGWPRLSWRVRPDRLCAAVVTERFLRGQRTVRARPAHQGCHPHDLRHFRHARRLPSDPWPAGPDRLHQRSYRMSLTYVDEVVLGYNIRSAVNDRGRRRARRWCSTPRTARHFQERFLAVAIIWVARHRLLCSC